MSDTLALYIHIPFCRRRCGYCSFTSYAGRQADIPAYLTALRQELAQKGGSEPVSSVYFGGGTPSLLSPGQLEEILNGVNDHFRLSETAEISLEANPGTVDAAWLQAVRPLGVNRLSLGMQSLNDSELALLGRIHTAADVTQAFNQARRAGFDNINLDLIYGLPGQTVTDWRQTLHGVLALQPEHLSLYALTLEDNAPVQQAINKGGLPAIDPDTVADQYELAEAILEKRGYRHYEISNWARPGWECRHNLVYWQNRSYLGFGAAAHSCRDSHRTANTASLDDYLAAFANGAPLPPDMDEAISPELELAETVILGLRMDTGIDAASLRNRFGTDITEYYRQPIREMAAAGLLDNDGANIKLTRRGRLLSNEVFWRLLPEG